MYIKMFEQFLREDSAMIDEKCGGLDPYAGGTEKTPTGEGNEFTNNKFGIKMSDLCKFAKDNGLSTENNTQFQRELYAFIEKNEPSLIEKMWKTYGDTKNSKASGKRNADTYADGMLGARTLFLVSQKPNEKPKPTEPALGLEVDYQFMDVPGKPSQRRAKILIRPSVMAFDAVNKVNIQTWVAMQSDANIREERGARVKYIVIFPNTVDDFKVESIINERNGYAIVQKAVAGGFLTGGKADYSKPDPESGKAYLITQNEYYSDSWKNKKAEKDITEELLRKGANPEELRKYLKDTLTPTPPSPGSSDGKSGKDPFMKKPEAPSIV